MRRLIVRGAAAFGALVLATGATTAAVGLTRDDAGSAGTAARTDLPSAEVLKYWADARSALSPLLVYVRILPEAVNALEHKDGRATGGQIHQAEDMADSFATARDLVGRIPVPAGVSGGVGELLQVACQLYRQAALEVASLRPKEYGSGSLATLRRASSLHLIGDRLIDQTRRVLNIDAAAAAQAPIELRYAPPVPSLADVTGVPAAARPEASIEEALGAARALLEAKAGTAPEMSRAFALTNAARALETAPGTQGEDVLGARLAILLAVVGEDARAAGAPKSLAALTLLSADVWNTARTLAPRPHPALTPLDDPGIPRSKVWTGGAFDGRPPALKPGDGVGSGLPGGLPAVDPVQILRG